MLTYEHFKITTCGYFSSGPLCPALLRGSGHARIAFSVESLHLTRGIAFSGGRESVKVRVVHVEELGIEFWFRLRGQGFASLVQGSRFRVQG